MAKRYVFTKFVIFLTMFVVPQQHNSNARCRLFQKHPVFLTVKPLHIALLHAFDFTQIWYIF